MIYDTDYITLIKSFNCKETEKIWKGENSKKLPYNIQERALRKLRQLNAALCLEDLINPPSNYLEKLKGDLKTYMSVRINNQWRLCFEWKENEAYSVEICDYH